MVDVEIVNDDEMHIRPTQFDSHSDALVWCCLLTNEGGPELHSKPLDAIIGQVFALHHPGGQQGHMQGKNHKKAPYSLAILMAVVVRRREGVQGYNGSHWLMPPGKYCDG